jgi:O-methyltransferase involved in polyketide biosynthesis
MDTLNTVSETALITLKSRVQEAEKDEPVIRDEVAQECLTKIRPLLPIETQNRVLNRNLPATLTGHIALRARKYDAYTKAFLAENQAGLVVSLGSGFDTRYWRVSDKAWNYIEVDLPEVIAAKNKVLGDRLTYRTIGCSVEEVRSIQSENILFLAEGLLMYLPPAEVEGLFNKLAETFSKSEIVFEVVNKKYTTGLGKKSVEARMKRNLGSEAGASYEFGVREASEVETYGPGIEVVEEWSYFEDEDIRPKFLRLFRHFKFMTRTQWTIKATIGLG